MKRTLLLAISIVMAAVPVAAQHGGSPKPATSHGAPAPKTTTHAPAPKTTTDAAPPHSGSTTHGSAPKATHGSSAPKTTHGSSAPKVGKTTPGGGHTASKTTTHASSVKAPKTTTATKPAKTAKTTKAAKATTTTTVVPMTRLSKVQQKLQRNTNLASKLQSRLPAGTNLTVASSGFRNLGQFVAAVNVSNNLGIPFWQLKRRMVDRGMSLGQAIQDTRPRTTDTVVVVHRAESDADVMIRTTEQTTAAKHKKVAKSTRGEQ